MKYKVFISSVQKEFDQERIALAQYLYEDELLSSFYEPFLFEEGAANEHDPASVYLDEVNQSDIYVALLGQEYGFEFDDGLSPTEKEYDAATAKHLPRWVYIKGDSSLKRHEKEQQLIRKAGDQVSRKRFANLEELKKELYRSCVNYLKRQGKIQNLDFDQSTAPNVGIDAIDADLLRKFIVTAREKRNFPLKEDATAEDVLTHLSLYRNNEIVNSALLLFNRNPQQYFPSATIKCARFHGNVVQKPIPDYKEYKGTVYNQIDQAVDFVLSIISLSTGSRTKSNAVETEYEIPRAVISEAIINAVAHRDYNSKASVQVSVFKNRIEISNPGSLPKELSIDALGKSHKSYPYNLNLADCLFQTGTIERYGTGTVEMYELSEESGLNAPQYSLDEGVKVTLWRSAEIVRRSFGETSEKISKDSDKNLEILISDYELFIDYLALENNSTSEELRRNFGETSEEFRKKFGDRKALLLFLIALSPKASAKDFADQIGVSSRTIETYLAELKDNTIERIGPAKGGSWKIK